MKKELLESVHASILAERETWARMSPDEKLALMRDESAKAALEAAEADRVTQIKLDELLGAFQRLAAGLKPMDAGAIASYNWKRRTIPAMREIGIDSRHCVQIAPNWNCPEQEAAFEWVKELCRNRGAIVILAGNRGAGKTTIPCQLMRERIEQWNAWNDTMPEDRTGKQPLEPGRYEKLARLGSMFKPLYSDIGTIRAERLNGIFEVWCEAPFLAIDEIHEADDLKAATRMLIDLLDRRYSKRLDTVLISNHDPAACQRELNPSILSRIDHCGAIIPCQWESWRAKR